MGKVKQLIKKAMHLVFSEKVTNRIILNWRTLCKNVDMMEVKFLFHMPKGFAHKRLYFKRIGKKLDLKHPKDFNEKLQWLMVYGKPKKYARFADKLLVRSYIAEKGYSNLLTNLYGGGVRRFENIDFSSLPDKFVLKTNHASGSVFICTDKKTFDFKKAGRVLTRQLRKDYAINALEYHYAYIKPRLIICEEYLQDLDMKTPLDYKIHCFGGKPECIMLCSERDTHVKYDFYDLNWNYLSYSVEGKRSSVPHPKPKNFDEMVRIAEDLSKGFDFVRVDLYNINGKIYFGELTMIPWAGLSGSLTQEALDYLGGKLRLPFEK